MLIILTFYFSLYGRPYAKSLPTPLFPLLGGVRGGSPTQQNVEKLLRNGITPFFFLQKNKPKSIIFH
ncbi:hypothetical protein D4Z78_31055 [Okeania hirsuta]|nr:hypothetical protein D4Z78_31055 [Okeania hirsuta]